MLLALLNGEITQNDYLNNNNAILLYKNLPKKVYGFVFRYKEINIITINTNISFNKKKMTILHEFAHIELNHLDKNKKILEFKIENIEDEADKYVKYLINNLD